MESYLMLMKKYMYIKVQYTKNILINVKQIKEPDNLVCCKYYLSLSFFCDKNTPFNFLDIYGSDDL